MAEDPHALEVPAKVSEYLLIASAHLSNAEDHLGEYQAKYADIKAGYIRDGENASVSKALADASEIGQKMIHAERHVRGVAEIVKVLKKQLTHLENQTLNPYNR